MLLKLEFSVWAHFSFFPKRQKNSNYSENSQIANERKLGVSCISSKGKSKRKGLPLSRKLEAKLHFI